MQKHLLISFSIFIITCISLAVKAQWNANTAINTPVAVTLGEQRWPVSCSDGAGGMIIAWFDDRDENNFYDVYVQRLDPNGVALWPVSGTPKTGISLASAGFVSNLISPAIDIVSDGNGGAVIVAVGGNSLVNRDIRAQRVDANGTKLWTSNGGFPIVVCINAQAQKNPKIARMSDGNFVVVWEDDRLGASDVTDIYAQRLLAATGDKTWSDDGVLVNGAVNSQYSPLLVAGNNGAAIISWIDNRFGNLSPKIYCQKMRTDSTRAWKESPTDSSGRPVAVSATRKLNLRMCTDGAGGAVMTWYNANTAINSVLIFAQRIEGSDNGNFVWTIEGVPVCNSSFVQVLESIDLSGNGVVISFYQETGGNLSDLFAQKLDITNGAPLWTAAGITVCDAVNSQNNSKIVSDGSGGAIIAWEDNRVSGINIYAQRLSSTGTAVWSTANGTVVASASSTQQQISLLADACRSFYTWVDFRNINTNGDIYASSLDCNGVVTNTTAVANVSNDEHLQIGPNPATSTLTIQNKGNQNNITVSVYDMNGRSVTAHQTFTSQLQLNMQHLPAGSYLILAEDKKRNVQLRKIIVKQ
jgi:Secretion system C-terminal sorting domain